MASKQRILIKNTNVFDGKSEELISNAKIIIEGNIVTAIETTEISEENFDKVIDAKGLTAVPGLTDAHVHFGRTFVGNTTLDYDVAVSVAVARKLLHMGFTNTRDAGGICIGLKQAIDQKVVEGPRIYPSGSHISQTSGHGDNDLAHSIRDIQYRIPTPGVLADGVDEIVRAVREQLYKGAAQIKLMAGGGAMSKCDPIDTVQYSLEEMKAAVNAAKDYGTYVMAHLYTPDSIIRAAKAGILSMEHAHILNDEAARAVADIGGFIDPMPQFGEEPTKARHMPDPVYREWEVPPKESKIQKMIDATERTTEIIIKHDLQILFGTDLMIMWPYYEPAEACDLRLYKERFGNIRTLRALTGNVNDLIKHNTYQNPYQDGEIGVLKKGAYADLLLVDGNPVEDVNVLTYTDNLKVIMKDGDIIKNEL